MKAHNCDVVISYTLEMQLPRCVLAHEIPILEVVHGANGVQKIRDHEEEIQIDPRRELRRLRAKYREVRTEDGLNVIDALFPDGSRDLEAFYAGTWAPPEAEAMASDDLEVIDQPNPEREELFRQLDELGVEYSKTSPTMHLRGLLEKYLREAKMAPGSGEKKKPAARKKPAPKRGRKANADALFGELQTTEDVVVLEDDTL